jgi:hypothetical protein
MGNFEIWFWGRMEKISWSNVLKNEKVIEIMRKLTSYLQ